MRVMFFLSFVLMMGLLLQQCWQSKTASEKWLYFFGEPARDYAGAVLASGDETVTPVPDELSGSEIKIFDTFIMFSPKQDPTLILAFSPSGPPTGEDGASWTGVGDGWYVRNDLTRETQ